MKFYPIILGTLFLSVPVHPINSDHAKTALFSVVEVDSICSFASNMNYAIKNIGMESMNPTASFKRAIWNAATIAVCSIALYDLHKPSLIALLGQNKSNNKSDEDSQKEKKTRWSLK